VSGINPTTRTNDDGIAQFRLGAPSYGLFNNRYPQLDWLDAYGFDRYFAANPRFFQANGTSVSYYPPKNIINETVRAGYGQTRFSQGRLTLLGGVRYEATRVRAQGRLNDTGNPTDRAIKTAGDYAKLFPSIHGRFEARRNLIGRLSYSTSSARPRISDIVPTTSVSYTPTAFGRGLVTQANPSLKPQYSKNYDAAVEYYFEPAGVFSAGWFHKEISDFISNRSPNPIIGTGSENGFDGRYAGFELATKTNLNRAIIQGWEFNYIQRLTGLPGLLKNFSLYGNYTRLRTSSSPDVPSAPGTVPNTSLVDFAPFTYNVGLNYDSHRLGARVEYHFKSRLKTGNNANPMLVQYMSPDATIDVNVNYRLRTNLTVFVDVINLFNESPYVYIGNTSRRQINEVYGTKVNAGLSGRF
jgi:iron complex outermembrane recepter protein